MSSWTRVRVVDFPSLVWILALSGAALVGCGAPAERDFDLATGQADEEESQAAFEALFLTPPGEGGWAYTVQESDQLEIVFFTHPEQNRFVRVRPDGKITLPYLGDVQAVGKSPPELAAELQERYQQVMIQPRVDVLVQQIGAPFYVLGEVRTPGEYALDRRMNLLQAVAKAGGYSGAARLDNFVVLRRAPEGTGGVAAIFNFRSYMDTPDSPANIEIRPYDIVWVPKDALSRWDNAATKAFRGILSAQDVIIRGWSLINFDAVYKRGAVVPR